MMNPDESAHTTLWLSRKTVRRLCKETGVKDLAVGGILRIEVRPRRVKRLWIWFSAKIGRRISPGQ